jgi:hypothetical protein
MRFSGNNLGIGDVPVGPRHRARGAACELSERKKDGTAVAPSSCVQSRRRRGQYVTFADATKRSSHCRIWPEQNPPESLMFVSQ